MTSTRTLITMVCALAMLCAVGVAPLAWAQSAPSAPPVKVTPTDAKNHVGVLATVCGKIVDAQIGDPGVAGFGKPVTFDIDEPRANPVFYFVTFGAKPGGMEEAQELIDAYKGKQVCVTGKINKGNGNAAPFIFAVDHTQFKSQAGK